MIKILSETFTLIHCLRNLKLYSIFACLVSATTITTQYLSGRFINTLIYEQKGLSTFSLLASFAFLGIISKRILDISITKIAKNNEIEIQTKLIDKIAKLSPFLLDKYKNTELGLKFFRDIPNISSFIKDFYPNLISTIASVFISLFVVFWSNWIIGFTFLLSLPITIFLILPYSNGFRNFNKQKRQLNDKTFNRMFEIFYAFPFLKSISAEKPYKSDVKEQVKKIADFNCQYSIFEIKFSFLISLFMFLGEYLVLIVSWYLAYKKEIEIGSVVFYQLLFASTFSSFSGLYKLLPILSPILESKKSINEIISLEEEEYPLNNNQFLSQIDIELKNVSFQYPDNNKIIIEKLNKKIPFGSIIGFEGINGSGKTTLAKLIIGYMKPSNGEILYSGISGNKINLEDFRSSISIVNQETTLITDTIKNNITLKNPKYDIKSIENVIEKSNFKTSILQFPNTLSYVIGNRAGKLSGGETQKLAITRALIRKPKFLILDEVTNHLDYESKCEISKLLKKLKGTMTIFLISHDPEILKLCDDIVTIGK